VIGGHHVSSGDEADLLGLAISTALTRAAQLWIIYLGLEPFLRRHWPGRIISWSRLLSGSFRDPLVGRDLLVGCLLGIATTLLYGSEKMLTDRLGGDFALRQLRLDSLLGLPGLARQLSFDVFNSLLVPLSCLVFLLLLAILARREEPAVVILWLVLTGVMAARDPNSLLVTGLAFSGLRAALHLFVWLRFGLLAGAAGQLVRLLCLFYPLTLDLSAWYADASLFSTLTILALAVYGFTLSIGGQRLLRSDLVDG
jgi:serine/threonine-protein kinase